MLLALAAAPGVHAAKAPRALPAPRADWVEPDFPFFSSVLDARKVGASFPTNNLTPRGIVLNLGRDAWACFDPDLLRIAAVWRGKGVTPKALAPGSYLKLGRKTPGGQTPVPEPDGLVWLANGIYPGWQTGAHISLADPRDPAPSPEEVGRGPLPEAMGRFEALRHVHGGVVLEYTVGGTSVQEWITVSDRLGQFAIERNFRVDASSQPLRLVVGTKLPTAALALGLPPNSPRVAEFADENSVWTVRIPAHEEAITFSVALAEKAFAPEVVFAPRALPTKLPAPRWPQEVITSIKRSTAQDAYVVDHVALPLYNPWRRGIRPGDIQFLQDGTGVVVTLDGDVWLVRGLDEPDAEVRWRRFASGLHEPMTSAIRDDQIYVFDKNGIWRLRDTNSDGEARNVLCRFPEETGSRLPLSPDPESR